MWQVSRGLVSGAHFFTIACSLFALIVCVSFCNAAPALAQDVYSASKQGDAVKLFGTGNGTISSQNQEETVVQGFNTAGEVRVNNLGNLEALFNVVANGLEILGIAWGGPTMIMGFMQMAAGTQEATKKVLLAGGGVVGGLAAPGAINWLVSAAQECSLFS